MTSVPLDKHVARTTAPSEISVVQIAKDIFSPLASLRLTVVLFAMSAFLVLAGTFAQVETGIWEVVNAYFRSLVVWIPLKIFFPPAWFPSMQWVSGGFWFPGGKVIGAALMINILAAHLFRFKIQAGGLRLLLGLLTLTIGVAITAAVILHGNWKDGIQDQPLLSWQVVWYAIFAGVILLFVLGVTGIVVMSLQKRMIEVIFLSTLSLVLGALIVWLVMSGSMLNDSAMRIVWHLIQGSVASLVMLAGCSMIFNKRGGIVLLHGGVALLMFNELFLAGSAIEEQITVEELKTTNVARDVRSLELTITDRSNEEYDEVIAIPQSMLVQGALIQDPRLPFDIHVDHMFRNSTVEDARKMLQKKPHVEYLDGRKEFVNPTQGIGTFARVTEIEQVGGANAGDANDWASMYVTLYKKGTYPGETGRKSGSAKDAGDDEEGENNEDGKDEEDSEHEGRIATILLSQLQQHPPTTMPDTGEDAEKVVFNDKTYELWLHMKRSYKPYQVKLYDVQKVDYVGTTIPRVYSSEFKLIGENNEQRKAYIQMNDPLRYNGETFYQSGYAPNAGKPGTGEVSTFSVVTNDGWMIPYVSCMIVGFGMLAQFATGLFRFLRRKDEELVSSLTTADVVMAIDASAANPEVINPEVIDVETIDAKSTVAQKPGKKKPLTTSSKVSVSQSLDNRNKSLASGLASYLTDPIFFGPLLVAGLLAVVLMAPSMRSLRTVGGVDEAPLTALGKIPIAHEGRIMPLDSYARVTLEKISQRQEIYYFDKDYEDRKAQGRKPAEGDLIDWKKHSAIEWMMDVVSRRDGIDDVRIFRIYDPDVLAMLKLKRRKAYRYSFNEIRSKVGELEKAADKARMVDKNERTAYHNAIQDLASKYGLYNQVRNVTLTQDTIRQEYERNSEEAGEKQSIPDEDMLPTYVQFAMQQQKQMEQVVYPLFVPVETGGDDEASWETLTVAGARRAYMEFGLQNDLKTTREVARKFYENAFGDDETQIEERFVESMIRIFRQQDPNITEEEARLQVAMFLQNETMRGLADKMREGAAKELAEEKSAFADVMAEFVGTETVSVDDDSPAARLTEIFADYRAQNHAELDQKTNEYLGLVQQIQPKDFSQLKINTEHVYNALSPFYLSIVFYVIGFILTAIGWIAWHRPINRVAFWLIAIGMLLHGFGILERVIISGRPPITNLYSSAVFIGWASVLVGLIIESLFRMGIGNVKAAFGGASGLLIAANLAVGQDTFKVVQAVLDTQFWLATHVICIALGYATTYVAGLAGIVYIFVRIIVPPDKQADFKFLPQIVYGVTCFAILFSFTGTVLGGLWADDSWGRFWGWDPKENGALIIVIWNALILHARWGGMVRARGMAVLAVVGCIVTTWSWFGVNQLGVGLHSYGFTDGVLVALGVSVITFAGIIVLGLIPENFLPWRLVNRFGKNS